MDEKKGILSGLISGNTDREKLENISYLVIVASGIMVALGIGLGSFVYGTVLIGSLGSFLFMVGIIIFIASQFMEEVNNG